MENNTPSVCFASNKRVNLKDSREKEKAQLFVNQGFMQSASHTRCVSNRLHIWATTFLPETRCLIVHSTSLHQTAKQLAHRRTDNINPDAHSLPVEFATGSFPLGLVDILIRKQSSLYVSVVSVKLEHIQLNKDVATMRFGIFLYR